jgi:hypothetical protein
MTTDQINAALGPHLTAKAQRLGHVYNLIRAGFLSEALGTLTAGQSHKQIRRIRTKVRRALASYPNVIAY